MGAHPVGDCPMTGARLQCSRKLAIRLGAIAISLSRENVLSISPQWTALDLNGIPHMLIQDEFGALWAWRLALR